MSKPRILDDPLPDADVVLGDPQRPRRETGNFGRVSSGPPSAPKANLSGETHCTDPTVRSDRELLFAILSGMVDDQANWETVDRLLAQFRTLAHVISARPDQLARCAGLGSVQILALRAVWASAIRLIRQDLDHRPLLGSEDLVRNYLIAVSSREQVECMRVLFLDSGHRLMADEVVSRGTTNYVASYPTQVFRRAIEMNATGLILTHNHPSGDPTPSHLDITHTIEFANAAALLSLTVWDHVIVGAGRVTSLREEGWLKTTSARTSKQFYESVPEVEY